MKRKQLKNLLLSFLITCGICCCSGAVDSSSTNVRDQVDKLMAFKASSIEADRRGFLKNWNPNSPSPCSWRGVSCSPTAHVIKLNMTNARLVGRLRISDLMALPNLTALHFSGNHFYGNLSSTLQDCSFQILDLSSNQFSEFLDAESLLRSCHRLVSLNLSRNSIPGGDFKFGPSLQQLDLSWNTISDTGLLMNPGLKCGLKLLDLSRNGLELGTDSGFNFSSCESLSVLHLSTNFISGQKILMEIPSSLEFLDLSINKFSGDVAILDFGSSNCNLRKLNLSYNSLEATRFPVTLANCRNVEELDLRNNRFNIEVPGDLLMKLKKLRKLFLGSNELYGEIPPSLGHLCGTLEELDLSDNRLTGELPSTFAFCSSLLTLNLAYNDLSGDFLTTVVNSITNLRYLQLPFNNMSGSMPQSLRNFTQLKVLDLSANALTGDMPSEFCEVPSPLDKIMLADNYLTGLIPSGIGSCKNLTVIDLSLNNLSGQIPREIWTLPKITDVVMWGNNITGEIPEGICVGGGNTIQVMILNNNMITGKIRISIANCTNLSWISLFSNRLSGGIPSGIGNLANLTVLQLGDNSLTGGVPPELGRGKSLVWLALNDNFLTGTIPSELADQTGSLVAGISPTRTFVFVKHEIWADCRGSGWLVELAGVKRMKRIYDLLPFSNCVFSRVQHGNVFYPPERNGSMIHIDLSHNELSGPIPESIGSMFSLIILNLGHNRLTGNVPYGLGSLKMLSSLDLSYNKLNGSIPESLQMLTFLSSIDVSNNMLTGMIPSGGQLTTFPSSRFENNLGLCGIPLPPCGSRRNRGHPSPTEIRPSSSVFLGGFPLHFLVGFLPFFVSSFCIFTCCVDLNFERWAIGRKRYKVHTRRQG